MPNNCSVCGSSNMELTFRDARYEWWDCLDCGRTRAIRYQDWRGSRVVPSRLGGHRGRLIERGNEFSGEIG